MRLNIFISMILASAFIAGCGNTPDPVSGRNSGQGQVDTGGRQKPNPNQINEPSHFPNLVIQPPDTPTKELRNSMVIDVDAREMIYFTYVVERPVDGSLFFDKDRSSLYLNECTREITRNFSMNILWQEEEDGQRKIIQTYGDGITEFPYKAGKKYYFTYALTRAQAEFGDCQSIELKFTVYPKRAVY